MLELAKTVDISKTNEPELTVVFLHGIAADSSSYDGLIGYLMKEDSMRNIRMVAFDWLGAGKSYTSDELNYDFKEQLLALENSISKLDVKCPIIIVAHSMGTMMATRFAKSHKNLVEGLVLVSAPIYTKKDIENPMFKKAMDGFKEVVKHKSEGLLESKAFNNEIKNIVSNTKNYDFLVGIEQPTIIIYGELDKIIAPFNLPRLLKTNSNISAVKTPGSHGVTIDKYGKIATAIKSFEKEKQ